MAAPAGSAGFEELKAFLLRPDQDAYPVHEVRECVCRGCGGRLFEFAVIADEGVVRRTCVACGGHAFIADSADHWDDEGEIEYCACPCREEEFAAAVGFSLYEDDGAGDVRWVYVALRCQACGEVGIYEDWKIGWGPSRMLVDQV